MGVYSLGAYSRGLRIWDLVKHSLAWETTAQEPTVSGRGLGIWSSIHLHVILQCGSLQPGSLQSRATDLASGQAFTCMGAYSLEAYSLGPWIWDLVKHALA